MMGCDSPVPTDVETTQHVCVNCGEPYEIYHKFPPYATRSTHDPSNPKECIKVLAKRLKALEELVKGKG